MNRNDNLNIKDFGNLFKKFYFFKKINECQINGNNYIFKLLPNDNKGNIKLDYYFNNIIIKYICDEIQIKCCDIDLIKTNKRIGVIIPDYRNYYSKYINGEIILHEYLNYLEENKMIEEYLGEKVNYPLQEDLKSFIINKMCNLETIWDALNYHYRNDDEFLRKDKVINIMVELCKRYVLDYFVMQTDRHERNWELEENINGVSLTPLYDNEMAFDYYGFIPEVKTEMNSNVKYESDLEKYLSYSSNYFKDYFFKIYKFLTPKKIEEIINKIEKERNFVFPVFYKIEIIRNYNLHYNDISQIIENIEKKGGFRHER